MGVVALGSIQKQIITDDEGNERMLHSLESCNYLKLEEDNHLLFNCSKEEKIEISILEEYTKDNETKFFDIYKVKIWKITLRELLLI